MKKNSRFFVCSFITPFLIFLLLSGVSLFIWYAIDAFADSVFLSIIITVMLLILPIGLFIWNILFMMPQLEINEKGITKFLFGIKLKSYQWKEIKFAYSKGDFNQWIFLSVKDMTKCSLSRNRIAGCNMYFFKTDKKMQILEQYLPENLKEQLKCFAK